MVRANSCNQVVAQNGHDGALRKKPWWALRDSNPTGINSIYCASIEEPESLSSFQRHAVKFFLVGGSPEKVIHPRQRDFISL